MPAIFCVRFSAMAGMDQGNEKQMSMNVATKVILCFSDLASAEKSVKSGHNFFPSVKWACVLVNLFSMLEVPSRSPINKTRLRFKCLLGTDHKCTKIS